MHAHFWRQHVRILCIVSDMTLGGRSRRRGYFCRVIRSSRNFYASAAACVTSRTNHSLSVRPSMLTPSLRIRSVDRGTDNKSGGDGEASRNAQLKCALPSVLFIGRKHAAVHWSEVERERELIASKKEAASVKSIDSETLPNGGRARNDIAAARLAGPATPKMSAQGGQVFSSHVRCWLFLEAAAITWTGSV